MSYFLLKHSTSSGRGSFMFSLDIIKRQLSYRMIISTDLAPGFTTALKLSTPFILDFFTNLTREHVSEFWISYLAVLFCSCFQCVIIYKMKYDYNFTISPSTSSTINLNTHASHLLLSVIVYWVLSVLYLCPFTGMMKTHQETCPQIAWFSVPHICP